MQGRLLVLAAALALAGAAEAHAAPRGTIIINQSGRRFEDVEYEVRGNRVYVKLKWGSTSFSMRDVTIAAVGGSGGESSDGEPASSADGATAKEDAAAVDWVARCMLQPPSDDWRPAESSAPGVRLQLQHATRDATLSVTMRSVEGDFEFDPSRRTVPRGVGEEITASLQQRYAQTRGGRPEPAELFSCPVYRLSNIAIKEYGDATDRVGHEVRFRRFGFEYALTLLVAEEDAGALAHAVDEAFTAFSFLPPLSVTDDEYADLQRGFAIRRPTPEWTLIARPFEDEMPVRLATAEDRAEVSVKVVYASDAAGVVRQMLRARRQESRYYSAERTQSDTIDGARVERFHFEDFAPGGRKKLRYAGFAAASQGAVLVFTGVAPLTDPDSDKLHREIDAALARVRIADAGKLREEISRSDEALALLARGHAQLGRRDPEGAARLFGEAIALAPNFARAYYLRALAKKEAGDFAGFRQDLEKAVELDPDRGYDAELAPSYAEEAQAAARERDFSRAVDLWVRAIKATRDDSYVRDFASALNSLWQGYQRSKEFHDGLTDVERRAKGYESHTAIHEVLARCYQDGVRGLMAAQDFSKARRWANRLKRLGGSPRYRDDAQRLLDQIDQREDQLRRR